MWCFWILILILNVDPDTQPCTKIRRKQYCTTRVLFGSPMYSSKNYWLGLDLQRQIRIVPSQGTCTYRINKKGQESLLVFRCFETTQKLRYNRINRKKQSKFTGKITGKTRTKMHQWYSNPISFSEMRGSREKMRR